MAWVRKLPSGRFQGVHRDSTGRRRTAVFDNKRAARLWAADQEAKVRQGTWTDPRSRRLTVGEWCDRWLAARVVEASTAAVDRGNLDRYVLPTWKHVPLAAVTRMEVQGWVRGLLDRGLAPGTAARALSLLSAMLTAAADETPPLIPANPCQRIKVGRLTRKERFFTHEEVERIDAALSEPWASLTLLQAWCGPRWGEAAALRVERVDWLRRRIDIIDVLTPQGFREYPKTRRSRRQIPVPQHVLDRLAVLAEDRPREALIFTRPDGRPLVYQTFYAAWGQALDKANVPYANPHTLRHTAASWLVMDGVPPYHVAQLLGHSSVVMTERYSHLAPSASDVVEAAWEVMVDRVWRSPGASGSETAR